MKTKRTKQARTAEPDKHETAVAYMCDIAAGLDKDFCEHFKLDETMQADAAQRMADLLAVVVGIVTGAFAENPHRPALARAFVNATVDMVEALNSTADKHPEELHHISGRCGLWPWFIRADGKIQDRLRAKILADKLNIGRGYNYCVTSSAYKPGKHSYKPAPLAAALREYIDGIGILLRYEVERYGDIPIGLKIPKSGRIPKAILLKIPRVTEKLERRERSVLSTAHPESRKELHRRLSKVARNDGEAQRAVITDYMREHTIPALKLTIATIPQFRDEFVAFIERIIAKDCELVEYGFLKCGSRYRGLKRGKLQRDKFSRAVEDALHGMCLAAS